MLPEMLLEMPHASGRQADKVIRQTRDPVGNIGRTGRSQVKVGPLVPPVYTKSEPTGERRVKTAAQERRKRRRFARSCVGSPVLVDAAFPYKRLDKSRLPAESPAILPTGDDKVRVLRRIQVGPKVSVSFHLEAQAAPRGKSNRGIPSIQRLARTLYPID